MKKVILAGATSLGVVAALGASAFAVDPATWNQTVQVTSNSVITISSTAGSPVTIGADPSANGGFGTVAVPITVASNNASGYTLTLSMISGDTHAGALFDGGTSPVAETVAGASGTLTANQWGYTAVTGATNTVPTAASTFSQVPNLLPDGGTGAVTLITAGVEGTSSVFVNYGAVIDYTLPSGITYANQVTYTASVNPAP
jgi:hypothetical protein